MPKMRRIAIWIVIIQVVIIIGMTSIYSFQRQGLYNMVDVFGSMEDDARITQPITYSLAENYTLVDDGRQYFTAIADGLSCYTDGTNWTSTIKGTSYCHCLEGYYGRECGIPEPVWGSCPSLDNCTGFKPRNNPRRLIHGININHELEFFQVRLEQVGDIVDVLIVGESNLTAGGDTSLLYLLPELKKGFMGRFQHKIIHVLIDHFPERGHTDGWFADTFIRDEMGHKGLERISGIRGDDLFLLLDADEIPDPRVLLFLKLYDGYPEPIALTLRWSVYGFFWKRGKPDHEEVTKIVAVSTMEMIDKVYDGCVMKMRRNYLNRDAERTKVIEYKKKGHLVGEWNIGRIGAYAGHHCSWCYPPEGIRLKLTSAQKDDKPRWGDYPDKLDLKYIAGLIRDGAWFDGSKPFFRAASIDDDPNYAPSFVLQNKLQFAHILNPPAPLVGKSAS